MVSLIERPASLAAIALQQIRTAIIEGTLPLGSAISESQLATSLGISKTPVREALAQLRMEGLVTIVPQSGTFVFTLSAAEVIEICELRQTLEAAALHLAIERNREQLIEGLAKACREMDAARAVGDEHTYLRLDSVFHEQFFAYCDNRYFAEAYHRIVPKVAALRTHLATRPDHTRLSYEEHKQILDAIRREQEHDVLAILDRHIERTRTAYTRNIEDIAAADSAPRGVPPLAMLGPIR